MGLWEDLGLDPTRCGLAALVGGGGKTTTLYALAREAVQRGLRVLVTTTTHIFPHPRLPLTDDPAALPALFARYPVAVLGRWDRSDKLSGAVPPEALRGLAPLVLTEADGARLHPLKVPADHEPVIPKNAGAVIAVAGLDALGRPISEVCHRPERAAALLGEPQDHRLLPTDLARLLSSPRGGRKSVPAGAEFRCLLNKADTPALLRGGEEVRALLAAEGISSALHSYPEKERGGLCWF